MMKIARRLILVSILAVLYTALMPAIAMAEEVVIGVLAPAGQKKAVKMWQPTIDYLQQKIPDHTFSLLPMNKKQLTQAVADKQVDFFLTNTGHYVELEALHGATRILTLKKTWHGQMYSQWGAIIFTLENNKNVYQLEDIKNKRFVAVYPGAFAGFQVAFRELVNADVMSIGDVDKVLFTGIPHNSPLRAVYDGTADVGTVPTGVLEEAIAAGEFQADTFRIINPREVEQFPFKLSSRLYPLWPLAKARHASELLAEKIVSALLSIPRDHPALQAGNIAGWTVPLDYSDIHNLMKEINVGPYKNYGRLSLLQFLTQYWSWLAMTVAIFTVGIVVIVYVVKLNNQLKDAHENLEKKVEESTEDLKNVNRQMLKEIEEHQRLHNELLLAKESLAKAQEISHLGNWVWNLEKGGLKCSDEVYRILGVDGRSALESYERYLDFVHPDDRESLNRAVQDVLMNPDTSYSFEHRIVCDDGQQRYVHEQGEVIRTDDGRPVKVIGTIQDITERKQIELKLEQAAEDEEILGSLMQISMRMMPIKDYLEAVLKMLINTVVWFKEASGACAFLVTDSAAPYQLEMIASINLGEERKKVCSHVQFGSCLCGESAVSRSILFSKNIDEKFKIESEKGIDHGHYCVPIENEEKLLGLLMMQLPETHLPSTHEILFLKRIANVLSMGISRHQAEEEIEYYAYHDTLTNLPNRRLLIDRLNQEMIQAERSNEFGAVIYIDLDNFKTLNDSLGHSMGDKLLLQIAERLALYLRKHDTIARLGGDEFVVVVPSIGKSLDAAVNMAGDIAEKIRLLLREPYMLDGHQYHTTTSLGISIYPKDQESLDDVLKQADSALYEAKNHGRDRVYFYQEAMQEYASMRLALENDIRQGLNDNQFMLYFQPQMDASGTITGAEALLRWQHPQKGFVSPADFIPVAEDSGLIVPLGNRVIEMACEFLNKIENARHPEKFATLSINISPKQFKQPDFVASLKKNIAAFQITPERLMLEVTEGVLVDNVEEVARKMHQLRELAIQFAIDDFGTGYSSMMYLKNLPLGELKIDQSFIRDVPENSSDSAIVEAIISMAEHLGLRVVAEGVENEWQLQFLKNIGCHYFQGYYFERPMSQPEFLNKYFFQV